MKKILVTLAAFGLGTSALVGLSATSAVAQDAMTPASFSQADADTSGSVTLAEAQVVLPDLTQEAFDAADANKDGTLDQAEFDALVAGTDAPPSSTVTTQPNLTDSTESDTDASSPNSPNGASDGNNSSDGGDDGNPPSDPTDDDSNQ